MLEIILLFFTGLLGGFLAGFTGIGGGIIYIIVLPFAFRNEGIEENSLAAIIVANSIFGIFVASFFSVISHYKLKTIYIKESLLISLPAVIISLLVLVFYVNTPLYSYTKFNVFIIILMSIILLSYFIKSIYRKGNNIEGTSIAKFIVSGAISGVVSSLGGVGGAITLIPLLQYWQKIPIKKAKSLSLTMIFLMTVCLSIINLLSHTVYQNFVGLVNFKIITPMIIGILISSSLGVRMAHRSSNKNIEAVFVLFIMVVMVNKIYILVY